MDIQYTYTKKRKDFGKQVMFCEAPPEMLDSINPDPFLQKQFMLRNPISQHSQTIICQSHHDINTKRVFVGDRGVNHAEGGWPKEIHYNDEDATTRFRRRIERDDAYIDCVLDTAPGFVHYIKQNNAIEMYQMYFKEMQTAEPIEKYSIRLNNEYKDPSQRPVSCICWTCDDDSKVVVTYCDRRFPIFGPVNTNITFYMWSLDDPYTPHSEFVPPTACWQVACSPINGEIVIGGLDDGRVCIFDIRAKREPVQMSPAHLAHRDPVTALLYLSSRTNTDFFSGSTDGMCMWWDTRGLKEPTERLTMTASVRPGEVVSLANSEPITALQYDRSFPTRFLCGTDTGLVINVNRKGKTLQETMSAVFHAHKGPVKTIHRSPCTSKMFITCGDWTAHIWSDDIHISPIISGSSQRCKINDIIWAPQRVSSYMYVGSDGKLSYYDLLRKYREPILVTTVSKDPLLKIRAHDEGRLIVVGDQKGHIFLLSLSENLVQSGERDKQLMVQTYERESKREHILEARIKEIRLKLRADEETPAAPIQVIDEEELVRAADEEYRKHVAEEIRRAGITTQATKYDAMRRR